MGRLIQLQQHPHQALFKIQIFDSRQIGRFGAILEQAGHLGHAVAAQRRIGSDVIDAAGPLGQFAQ